MQQFHLLLFYPFWSLLVSLLSTCSWVAWVLCNTVAL